jgi:hypothetical protein
MPDKALLDDPQLVRAAPLPAAHRIRRGQDFNLRFGCKIGNRPV